MSYGAAYFDDGGKLGLSGTIDEDLVTQWLQHPFFNTQPPKSLDRNAWDVSTEGMSLADGAATLAAFTARTILQAASLCPEQPESWIITGGGRHNQAIMEGLRRGQNRPVLTTEDVGWDGDAMEAEGFAYMAVRSVLDLPISFPSTTGCPSPMTGGELCKPKQPLAAEA